ncbi:hypothetical protein [Chrysiogenes arsenatis]|uniref:hypothetical protein n=1 Tax=Chrysiogenes arsenatis TaxID=309797 RepID=UPI00041D63F6|nr:hypothetical protein [Chrysiogenes arsenatis]
MAWKIEVEGLREAIDGLSAAEKKLEPQVLLAEIGTTIADNIRLGFHESRDPWGGATFPASAGMNRTSLTAFFLCSDVPRIRGDEPFEYSAMTGTEKAKVKYVTTVVRSVDEVDARPLTDRSMLFGALEKISKCGARNRTEIIVHGCYARIRTFTT